MTFMQCEVITNYFLSLVWPCMPLHVSRILQVAVIGFFCSSWKLTIMIIHVDNDHIQPCVLL